jgi:hypothetical protein
VTGDLTTCGHQDQFDTARDFLGGCLVPPKGWDGLRAADWNLLAILGNHDQWPGTNAIFGPPAPGIRRHVRPMPFVEDISLPGDLVLRFIAIDTDIDIHSRSAGRFLAQGEFTSMLPNAETMLGSTDKNQIRVMLLHHSRLYGTGRPFQPLVMLNNSRKALDQFLVDNNVQIMLCGHTHVSRIKRHRAKHPNGQKLEVLESCCGTTTQRDSIPYTWRTLFRQWPIRTLSPNTLVVHTLFDESSKLKWQSQVYIRNNLGFQKHGNASTPFQVWPS